MLKNFLNLKLNKLSDEILSFWKDEFDKAEGESDHAEAEADDAAIDTALGLIKTNMDAAVADVALAKAEETAIKEKAEANCKKDSLAK